MNYLEDTPEDKAFILGEKKIRNLYGLLYEFRNLDEKSYGYYAGSSHNYFADWIEYVIGNRELADSLRKTSARSEAIAVLEKAVENFRKKDESSGIGDTSGLVITEIGDASEGKEKEGENVAASKKKPRKEASEAYLNPLKKEKEVSSLEETENLLRKIAENEKEIKTFLWKHFAWDMAKEFMYGMALGMLLGLVLSKIIFRV